jgi:hypothetical protein
MNCYIITYEFEYKGKWHTMINETFAPGYAQAMVAFHHQRRNDFSVRVKNVSERVSNDQHSR